MYTTRRENSSNYWVRFYYFINYCNILIISNQIFIKLWFWRGTRCINRVANSNEGQHSSYFKTKIIRFHYSSKEYLTWPQNVGRVLLLRYAKNTIRNTQYVRTWSFVIVWNSSLLCHILLYNWCLWHEIKEKIMHIQIFFPPHTLQFK